MSVSYQFKVETILNEQRTKQEYIDDIKTWLINENYPKISDELIVLFLLSCINNVELTKKTIEAYFRIKNQAPEMFNDRDIDQDDLQKSINTIIAASLPVRTDNNDVIHFFKLQDTDYSKFELIPAMKIAYMIVDISLRTSPPDGLIVLIDVKGWSIMHLTRIKMGAIKTFFQFLQEGFPMRMKMIHILNANWILEKTINLIKVFMKSELLQQLKTHPPNMDMEDFYRDYIPAKCLPKEYGGELPDCYELNQRTICELRNLKEFFIAEERMRNEFKN